MKNALAPSLWARSGWVLRCCPTASRKERLAGLAEAMFQEDFSDSCLSYDVLAAADQTEPPIDRPRAICS